MVQVMGEFLQMHTKKYDFCYMTCATEFNSLYTHIGSSASSQQIAHIKKKQTKKNNVLTKTYNS